jgi:hypothetical protein
MENAIMAVFDGDSSFDFGATRKPKGKAKGTKKDRPKTTGQKKTGGSKGARGAAGGGSAGRGGGLSWSDIPD